MTDQGPLLHVGIDWATEKHDACVVETHTGSVLGERAFAHDGAGLAALADWIASFAPDQPPERVLVAIELPRGAIVETLLERGFMVHSLNPKQLDRFRDRFSPAGAKDDRRDARVLASSLRTDPQAFRRLRIDAPQVVELREWSRMATEVQEDRQRAARRLGEQLRRYFPQLLHATDDLAQAWFLELLALVPTPEHATRLKPRALDRWLKQHRVRRWQGAALLDLLQQPPLRVAAGTVQAASAHALQLADRLVLLNRQLRECERRIDSCVAGLPDEDATGEQVQQRDVAILQSLPGIGRINLATLLAEASEGLARRDYQGLRHRCGSAPVTRRSGKSHAVVMRRACDRRLRNATYHWARVAMIRDSAWRARYDELRARGHSHARALRGVTDRLLAVACAMLRNQSLYDSSRLRISVGAPPHPLANG